MKRRDEAEDASLSCTLSSLLFLLLSYSLSPLLFLLLPFSLSLLLSLSPSPSFSFSLFLLYNTTVSSSVKSHCDSSFRRSQGFVYIYFYEKQQHYSESL